MNRNLIIAASAVLLVTALAFYPCLNNGFTNWDDDVLVTDNRLIQELSPAGIQRVLFSSYAGLYHPLVLLSYAVEYRVAGLNPRLYHIDNYLLHLANTALVFWLALLLLENGAGAALCALLFGLHPLHVESVAWVSERKDVLYSLFYLVGLIAYVFYRRKGASRLYWLAFATFCCSLLSKPMAITFPAVLLIYDRVLGRGLTRKTLAGYLPYFVLACAGGVYALAGHYTPGHAVQFDIVTRVTAAGFGTLFYLYKAINPFLLSCIYPYSAKLGVPLNGWFYAAPVLAAAIAGAAMWSAARGRFAGFCGLFFLVSLAPVIQLIPVGQEIPADRYAYLPLLGLFLLAGRGLSLVTADRRAFVRLSAYAVVSALLVVFGALSWARCSVWHDSISLWNNAIQGYPGIAKSYKSRADAWRDLKKYSLAEADYEQALRLKPDYADVYNNRGNMYVAIGSFDLALRDLSRAIAIHPREPGAYYNCALAYAARGDAQDAITYYSQAIARAPAYAQAYNNRGVQFGKLGQYDKAILDFSRALALAPLLDEARRNRAFAYFFAKEYNKSLQDAVLLHGRRFDPGPAFEQDVRSKL